jgi:hypothetical protein
MDDREICQTLGLHSQTLLALKTEIIQFDKTYFEHQDSGTVFSKYLMQAKQNIMDLNRLIKTTKVHSAQGSDKTAYVAAIKLRAEVQDKCVKMGQDLGHIDKRAKEVDLRLDGKVDFNFASMSNADIQKEIQSEVNKLHQLADGNTTIEMREELMGVSGKEVRKFFPTKVIKAPVMKKRKVSLRK